MEGQAAHSIEPFSFLDQQVKEHNLHDYQLRILESPAIRCHDVENLLGEYVENEIPATLRSRIDEHFEDCSYCEAMKCDYIRTIQLASSLPNRQTLPDGVKNRLRQHLNRTLGIHLSCSEEELT